MSNIADLEADGTFRAARAPPNSARRQPFDRRTRGAARIVAVNRPVTFTSPHSPAPVPVRTIEAGFACRIRAPFDFGGGLKPGVGGRRRLGVPKLELLSQWERPIKHETRPEKADQIRPWCTSVAWSDDKTTCLEVRHRGHAHTAAVRAPQRELGVGAWCAVLPCLARARRRGLVPVGGRALARPSGWRACVRRPIYSEGHGRQGAGVGGRSAGCWAWGGGRTAR